MAHAELDGLGPADGPVVTWAVPRDFAQEESPRTFPFGDMPGPAPSGTGSPLRLWLGLGCLLLLVVVLLRRIGSKSPPR
jgi:hypothetical protein